MAQVLNPSTSKSPPPDTEVAPAPPSTPAVTESPRTENFSRDGEPTLGGDTPHSHTGLSRLSAYSFGATTDSPEPDGLNKKNGDSKRRRVRPAPLLRRLKPMMVLENSGSVARDHLASERTFLAYVRTSLAIASTGVALVQLFTIAVNTNNSTTPTFSPTSRRMQAFARPLGATTVILGLIVLTIGVTRYFTIQTALTKGMFPVARLVITGITVTLAVLIAILFGVLIAEKSPAPGDD